MRKSFPPHPMNSHIISLVDHVACSSCVLRNNVSRKPNSNLMLYMCSNTYIYQATENKYSLNLPCTTTLITLFSQKTIIDGWSCHTKHCTYETC